MFDLERFHQQISIDVNANPNDYAPEECQLIETNPWWLKRYLEFHKDVDKAMVALKKAANWRKENNIFSLKEKDFPEEIYRINIFTVDGVDRKGTPISWYWGRQFYRNDDIKPHIQRYMGWMIHRLDAEKGSTPGLLIIDASGCGLANVDLNFSFFIIELLQNFYPCFASKVVNVDLPFILNTTSKIILGMMNEQLRDLIKFIKHQQLTDYISLENIPIHLGGTMVFSAPKAQLTCRSLKEMDMKAETIAKIYSTFKL